MCVCVCERECFRGFLHTVAACDDNRSHAAALSYDRENDASRSRSRFCFTILRCAISCARSIYGVRFLCCLRRIVVVMGILYGMVKDCTFNRRVFKLWMQ